MTTYMTGEQFDRDPSGARKAAADGPVVITDRVGPTHVLVTFDAFDALVDQRHVGDLLGGPDGVAEVDFITPRLGECSRPAEFD